MIRILTVTAFSLLVAASAIAADSSSPSNAVAVGVPPKGTAPHTTPAAPVGKPFVYLPKESDVVVGKADAPVIMVEYASLSCPHCSHFFNNVLPALTSKYIDTGKVKLVYRNFPLNDPALKAAELVQCAPADQREAYIKVLFKTQTKWAYDIGSYRDALGNIALQGGMDRLKFEACMNDKKVERTVLDVAKEANDDYIVNSTPTFYINGVEEKGDHDVASMSKTIDAALAKQAAK